MPVQTLPVLDAAELRDGELRQVRFADDGDVLLCRLGTAVHATSAYCTHYGAPLAAGVLTADARIVCPWHGACFNVTSGDIEDAPAPAPIHTFKTDIRDGVVYVTADPAHTRKENKARAPTIRGLPTLPDAALDNVVIVGGGSGAFFAVESLREHGYPGNITILSSEEYAPIDRTKLSKALPTEASSLEWRTAADLKIKYGVNLRLSVRVDSVDVAGRTVTFSPTNASATAPPSKESLPYSTLILATGGSPRRLPIPGADLANTFTVRHVGDIKKIVDATNPGTRIVILGSSFISLELAVAMAPAKKKCAAVHVVGITSEPLEGVLGSQVGSAIRKFHESQGVIFHMSSNIEAVVPAESESTRAGGVLIAPQSGPKETIPADIVIFATGVAPVTAYLQGVNGVQFTNDGGVKVDEYLKVRGLESVFAIGDIAVWPDQKTGEERRIEHWNVAGNHGRAVGRTIARQYAQAKGAATDPDPAAQPFVKIPIFWSAQGQQLRYCGTGAGFEDIIMHGDPGEMKFIAYYVKKNTIVAVASMQNDPVVVKASELLRLGLMPSPEEVRAGKNLLDIDISSQTALAAGRV